MSAQPPMRMVAMRDASLCAWPVSGRFLGWRWGKEHATRSDLGLGVADPDSTSRYARPKRAKCGGQGP